MKQLLNLYQNILDNGIQQSNRTGVDTLMIPGAMLQFDLREGFPAVTTKKLAFKAVVGELIGFLRGYTNAADFRALGCNIWDANANDPGKEGSPNAWLTNPNRKGEDDLGKIYGKVWKEWNSVNWKDQVTEVRIRKGGINKKFEPPFNPIQIPTITDDLTGKVFTTNAGDEYTVIKKLSSKGSKNSKYLIQFTATTTIVEASRPSIRSNQIRDPYSMTTANKEGCLGILPKIKPKHYKLAYNLWYNMMKRCYDTSLLEFHLYGGIGVYVHQQWRCFSNFLKDLPNIPLFDKWVNDPTKFDFDKDYYCSSSYSPNTCIFLPKLYNVALSKVSGCKYIATNKKTGSKYEFTNQVWGARNIKLKHSQAISTALLHSPASSTREWIFEKVEPREGYVYRQQLYIDQVQEVIKKLYTNPTDRRMIISAWRPDEFDQMALPPCHVLYQFIADNQNKVLHLCLYQRSCDGFLGVPFNVASASLFLAVISKMTGFTAGIFTHFQADSHLYVNHLDQVREQLSREPYPLPKLECTIPTYNEIPPSDWANHITPDMFNLVDYQHHAAIKAEMAV